MRHYLVVDDNTDFAENISEILQDTGAVVDLAFDGRQALECLATVRYDALISDMQMPVMGGAEMIRRARRIDPGVPAIIVTAHATDEDMLAVRKHGLVAVLPKPLPIPRLIALLAVARRNGVMVVVEDDLVFSDVLTDVLAMHGFGVVTAGSVTETEQLAEIRLFAGLVDLRIPGGADGKAMSRLLERFPGLPMVAMSGYAETMPPESVETTLRKPFHMVALLDCMERLYRASTREQASV